MEFCWDGIKTISSQVLTAVMGSNEAYDREVSAAISFSDHMFILYHFQFLGYRTWNIYNVALFVR